MTYRLAIFDFDGTLADSFPFFLSVFNRIADQHGFRRIDDHAQVDRLRHYDTREIMRHIGMPAWKLPLAAATFKSLMNANAGQVRLFPQVDHALRTLARDLELTIVSSNSEENVRQVLGPELASLISQYECGMSIFGKTSRIRKVIKRAGVTPGAALYIGDQATDADAARRAGIAFAAVHWGYAPIEALRKVDPEHEFDLPLALATIASL